MTSRRLLAAALGMVLAVGGCAADAQRAGDDAAAAGASGITFFLRNVVVRPEATPSDQLARVKSWLAAPPPADLEQLGRPEFRILPGTPPTRIEIAVWAYGETTAIEGKDGAVGHVCRRFSVNAASHLVAATIACPSDVPHVPD